MPELKTATVDTATGLFCEDGRVTPTTIVVQVSENPDVLRHRYSGDPQNPLRAATAAEIAAATAAKAEAKIDVELNKNDVRWLAAVLGDLTAKTPDQVRTAMRTHFSKKKVV